MILKLSKEIYDDRAINMACKDYKEYARIIVKNNNDSYELLFDKCRYDKRRTILEFENYLIGLENKHYVGI